MILRLKKLFDDQVSFDRVSNFQEGRFYYTAKKLTKFLTQILTQY